MSIDKVAERVRQILEELESKEMISTKIILDRDAEVMKIYCEGSDYVKRASLGVTEILELAYTTAEHHPYWSVLYHAAEISKATLEKWESEFTAAEISEMSWRCDEIKMTLQRLNNKDR